MPADKRHPTRAWLSSAEGSTVTEYALIAALISIGIATALLVIQGDVKGMFDRVEGSFHKASHLDIGSSQA